MSDVFFRCKVSPPRTASGIIHSRKQWEHMPDFRLREMFSTFHELPQTELSLAWVAIVEAYSGLKLTKPTQDRLIALSGVADEFGRALSLREKENLVPEPQEVDDDRSVYVAGLWLSFLLDGLLWEKVGEEPHERLSSIPSYSWASVYARVQWSSTLFFSDQAAGDCQVVNVLYAQSCEAVALAEHPSFVNGSPEYRPPTDTSRRPTFPVLALRTKVQPVILGSKFQTEDDRDLVARLTEQRSSSSGQTNTNWRKVASYLDREHISGWASLDDPEFQGDCSSQVIFALHIVRRFAKSTPGVGHRTGIHAIFSVLFVKRVEGLIEGYERIGVGVVFGKEIEKQFQTAVTREVRLL